MTCKNFYVKESRRRELGEKNTRAQGIVGCLILLAVSALLLASWYGKSGTERAWITQQHTEDYYQFLLAVFGWILAASGIIGLFSAIKKGRSRAEFDAAANAYLRLSTDGICGSSTHGSLFRLPYDSIQNVAVTRNTLTITSSEGIFIYKDLQHMGEAADLIMQNKAETQGVW